MELRLDRVWAKFSSRGGCPRGRETIFRKLKQNKSLRSQRSFPSQKAPKKKQKRLSAKAIVRPIYCPDELEWRPESVLSNVPIAAVRMFADLPLTTHLLTTHFLGIEEKIDPGMSTGPLAIANSSVPRSHVTRCR